jgi:hypothetical protein
MERPQASHDLILADQVVLPQRCCASSLDLFHGQAQSGRSHREAFGQGRSQEEPPLGGGGEPSREAWRQERAHDRVLLKRSHQPLSSLGQRSPGCSTLDASGNRGQ